MQTNNYANMSEFVKLQPKLGPQNDHLKNVPQKERKPESEWMHQRIWSGVKDWLSPTSYLNSFTLHSSFNALDTRMTELTKKVETLQLPFHISEREGCRTLFKKFINPENEVMQEIFNGIQFFKARSLDKAQIAQLE